MSQLEISQETTSQTSETTSTHMPAEIDIETQEQNKQVEIDTHSIRTIIDPNIKKAQARIDINKMKEVERDIIHHLEMLLHQPQSLPNTRAIT